MITKKTIDGVTRGAKKFATIIPRALLMGLLGLLVGAAMGIGLGMIVRSFTPQSAFNLAAMTLVGLAAGGLLGVLWGLRSGLYGLSDEVVEVGLVPLLQRISGEETEKIALKLSRIVEETRRFLSELAPKGSEFILLRWVRQVSARASEAAVQRLLSACEEVARPGADGELEVDPAEVTGKLVMGKAKAAARLVVTGGFRIPLLVAMVAAVLLLATAAGL